MSQSAASKRGVLQDISFNALSKLSPGCYVAGDGTNVLNGSPLGSTSRTAGNIVVFQATDLRVWAVASFDDGSVWSTTKHSADNWVRLS